MHERLVLDNGLRVLQVPFRGTEATTVLILFEVGSRYESPELWGASHFIEHLMFKGTKRRPTTLAISRQLDAIGAEYNAFTGKELTGYYVKAVSKHVPLAIDMLEDMLFHSVYDAKEMDRERRVIIEEINMYHENPLMHVDELLEEALWNTHPLGREIAGTHETMLAMKRDALLAFRDQHYQPRRMVICLAGNIPEGTTALVKKRFGARKNTLADYSFPTFAFPKVIKPRYKVEFKNTKQVQVAMGFPAFSSTSPSMPALELLSTILGGTMSSRLFVAVREKRGLAYSVRSSVTGYDDTGALVIQSGLDASRLALALKTIMSEVRLFAKKGVSARELREAKDHENGRTLLKLEDSSHRAQWYASSELTFGKVKTPEEYAIELSRVTLKHIQAIANDVLVASRAHLSAIGPYRESAQLSALIR